LISTIVNSDIKQRYSIGEKITNEVILDNKISIDLSDGEWEVVERTGWRWGNYTGEYIFIIKANEKEIVESISLNFLNTGGKRIADINSWLYEVVFVNKHDGCYKRPEYYKLELFHKGATINCMIISHTDVNKEIYNPDDKEFAYLNEKIISWIHENSIELPKIMLTSEHILFSRLASSKFYGYSHSINPKFFEGPKTKFITEDTSEYHPFNIDKYPIHEKFMNNFMSSQSLIHVSLEENIGIKDYQKLELSKYINKKTETKKSNGTDKGDIVSQIKDLKELLDTGALTKEEFTKAKKKLLN
tara:strand:+ start:524 stop:1429 length:906 start_codon:yes stop_codon:yes gene_type:complete